MLYCYMMENIHWSVKISYIKGVEPELMAIISACLMSSPYSGTQKAQPGRIANPLWWRGWQSFKSRILDMNIETNYRGLVS